jgi:hypothetical protein
MELRVVAGYSFCGISVMIAVVEWLKAVLSVGLTLYKNSFILFLLMSYMVSLRRWHNTLL